MIRLEMKSLLPKVREAFSNRTLQMFIERPEVQVCVYSGPCAIGAGLRPDEQARLDANNESIMDFIQEGTVPKGEEDCFRDLQDAHDAAVTAQYVGHKEIIQEAIEYFDQFLTEQERRFNAA